MLVKQISVYIENVRGSLRELTQLLGENQINLLALSIADTAGFGIVKIIVKSEEIDTAMSAMRRGGYIAMLSDVVCICIPNRPLGLASVLRLLEVNDIDIEYTYSFCRSTHEDAVIIVRPSDFDKCESVLSEAGVRMLSQNDINQF